MRELASKGTPGVQFGEVDLGKHPALGDEHNIKSIPETRIYHNGAEIGGFKGVRDGEKVATLIGQYIASVPAPTEAVRPAIAPEVDSRPLPLGISPL